MKTSEFIKRVEELGHKIHEGENYLAMSSGIGIIARVYEDIPNAIDTYWNTERSISNDLFDLCVEYAKTPIEERKDIKKYYLYNPFKKAYFMYYVKTKKYTWLNQKQQVSSSRTDIQTQFTEEEIENHLQLDLDITECLEIAYNEIKDRKEKLVNGVFVKEEDLQKENKI